MEFVNARTLISVHIVLVAKLFIIFSPYFLWQHWRNNKISHLHYNKIARRTEVIRIIRLSTDEHDCAANNCIACISICLYHCRHATPWMPNTSCAHTIPTYNRQPDGCHAVPSFTRSQCINVKIWQRRQKHHESRTRAYSHHSMNNAIWFRVY